MNPTNHWVLRSQHSINNGNIATSKNTYMYRMWTRKLRKRNIIESFPTHDNIWRREKLTKINFPNFLLCTNSFSDEYMIRVIQMDYKWFDIPFKVVCRPNILSHFQWIKLVLGMWTLSKQYSHEHQVHQFSRVRLLAYCGHSGHARLFMIRRSPHTGDWILKTTRRSI